MIKHSLDLEQLFYSYDKYPNIKFAKELSITPYIFNSCSAKCSFCSERTQRMGITFNKNFYTTSPHYSNQLYNVLKDFKEHHITLSLSGMEPSESINFLQQILRSIQEFKKNYNSIHQIVMYTNLSGVVNNKTEIQQFIQEIGLNKIEVSRHHYDEEINQQITRFKLQKQIKKNTVFEQSRQSILPFTNVKLVCVLQKAGINSLTEIIKYLEWGIVNNIKDFTFRALAILTNQHKTNKTTQYIQKNYISIQSFISEIENDPNFKINSTTKGYYYTSIQYIYKGVYTVTLEASDYNLMLQKHDSNSLQKLILYPNGTLCKDWNTFQKLK